MGPSPRSRHALPVALAVATLVAAAVPPSSAAQEGGPQESPAPGDPDVVAPDARTTLASSIFRLPFRAHRAAGEVLDPDEVAEAYAACHECREAARETLLILAATDPDPQAGCSLCERLGSMYRWALGLEGDVSFTEAGHRRLAEVGRQLRDDPSAGRVEDLREAMARILDEELDLEGGGP